MNLAAGTFSTEDCWTFLVDSSFLVYRSKISVPRVPIYHRVLCDVKFSVEVTNFYIKSHFLLVFCVHKNTMESITQKSQFIHQNH